ncbi:MAG: MFS transporter [Chloroflexota bacterium]
MSERAAVAGRIASDSARVQHGAALPWRLVATVTAGTLLNPLNSSMISVALISAANDLRVDIPTATWLVSSFYLVGATGMPLAGRIADLYGTRRVFRAGMLIVLVASALAALAPSFGWLMVWRVLQALGSATGSPAGQATFRAQSGSSRPPAGALSAVTIANNTSAAFGPVLGGLVVALAGWPGIFWVNIPIAAVGLFMAWRWFPPDAPRRDRTGRAPSIATAWRELDVPGVALFSIAILALLAFFLSVAHGAEWPLLAIALMSGFALVIREQRVARPFFDVRFLQAHLNLVQVYVSFGAASLIFYAAFFGLPLWLQQVRHFDTSLVGLIVLPISGVSALLMPFTARLIARRGLRLPLIIGACSLLIGLLLQLTLSSDMTVPVLMAITAVIGTASAFNNLGLQAALYQFAPAEWMGTATGQFQTFRYIGATLCTALLGLVFASGTATTEGLHTFVLILLPVAVMLLIGTLRMGEERV